jgi:hypothetical protein
VPPAVRHRRDGAPWGAGAAGPGGLRAVWPAARHACPMPMRGGVGSRVSAAPQLCACAHTMLRRMPMHLQPSGGCGLPCLAFQARIRRTATGNKHHVSEGKGGVPPRHSRRCKTAGPPPSRPRDQQPPGGLGATTNGHDTSQAEPRVYFLACSTSVNAGSAQPAPPSGIGGGGIQPLHCLCLWPTHSCLCVPLTQQCNCAWCEGRARAHAMTYLLCPMPAAWGHPPRLLHPPPRSEGLL